MKRLNSLAHICPFLPHLITYRDNFTNESIYDTIQDIAPSMRDSILLWDWERRKIRGTKWWSEIFTDDGLCFAFNALNSRDIYTDEYEIILHFI